MGIMYFTKVNGICYGPEGQGGRKLEAEIKRDHQAESLGPGKLFSDCSEAERLERINYARKLLHKALAPGDEWLRNKGHLNART